MERDIFHREYCDYHEQRWPDEKYYLGGQLEHWNAEIQKSA